MEWELTAMFLLAGGIGFFSGMIAYLKITKRRDRRTDECFIASAGAALLSTFASMIVCYHWCNDPREKWVVLGACGLAGLMGLTPKKVLRFILKLFGGVPSDEGRDPVRQQPNDPLSD